MWSILKGTNGEPREAAGAAADATRIDDDKGILDQVLDWALRGDLRNRVLAIVLVGLVLYGTTIALDGLVLRPFFGEAFSEPTDLDFYRFRADSILDGKIPYVDFYSESPPLIMYLFVVPQIAGGSTSAYQLFFALFSILTAVTLYLGLRAKDERLAMMAGLAYLAYPLGLMEFGIGAQDEAVTTFLFILPLVLMYLGKGGLSGLFSFIGVLTKMFNVLLVPWMFLQADKRNRVAMLAGFVALVLLLVVPFIILFPDQLPSFRYYFLGNPDYPTGGSSISPWHYLNELGFGLPGWAGVVLTLAGLGSATLFAFWKKMSLWEGAALVVLAFFLFYPKILLVYFVMPAALLMMWGLEDRKVMLKLMAMIVPLYISVVITGNGMNPMADEPSVWLLGIILSLIGWGLMFHTWWAVRTKKVFFERS